MAIEFRTEFTNDLDEALVAASPVEILFNANKKYLKWLKKAKEVKVPKFSIDGPADYNGAYTQGNYDLEYETVEADYDRARKFVVDAVDDMDTDGLIKEVLLPEYVNQCEAPDVAAYIFGKLAQTEGIGSASATLDGDTIVAAIRDGISYQSNRNVPNRQKVLFITDECMGMLEDLDTTKSKAVLARFDKVITVSPDIFATKFAQNDGTTEGQTVGGYVKADDALDINFAIVYLPAVIAGVKHRSPKYIENKYNDEADGDTFALRTVAYCKVKENQTAGVYIHTAPVAEDTNA